MSHLRRVLLVLAAFAAILGVAALAAAWRAGQGSSRWTDGRSIRVSEREVSPRRVLWTPAERVAGTVNTPVDEYEPRVSADGTTLVLVRGRPGANADLFVAHRTPRGWTEPAPIAAIDSEADELGPELSADGATLWFYSDRAGGLGGYDLWFSRAEEGEWSAPINAGPAINTPFNEYGAALSPDGATLYFSSNRPRPDEGAAALAPADSWSATLRERRARHDYDLYVARSSDGRWNDAIALVDVNTGSDEGAPAISPAGDFLYFASDRPGGAGGFDLFRLRIGDGSPGAGAQREIDRLDSAINTAANELDPALSADGFRLFFSSTRAGGDEDVWTSVSREVFLERDPGPSLASLLGDAWTRLWPWLLLLALLAGLLGAAWWLCRSQAWRRRFFAMGLLAQCVVISIIVHALIAMLLSVWHVREGIGELLRGSGGTRVVLAGGAVPGNDVGLALRMQLDEGAEPSPLPEVHTEPARLRLDTPVDVAQPSVRPSLEAIGRIVANIIDSRPAPSLPRPTDDPSAVDAAQPDAPKALASADEPSIDSIVPRAAMGAPATRGAAAVPPPPKVVDATVGPSALLRAALDARRMQDVAPNDAPLADVAAPPVPRAVASETEPTIDAIVPRPAVALSAARPAIAAPQPVSISDARVTSSAVLQAALDERPMPAIALGDGSIGDLASPSAPTAVASDAEPTIDAGVPRVAALAPVARPSIATGAMIAPPPPTSTALDAAIESRPTGTIAAILSDVAAEAPQLADGVAIPPSAAGPSRAESAAVDAVDAVVHAAVSGVRDRPLAGREVAFDVSPSSDDWARRRTAEEAPRVTASLDALDGTGRRSALPSPETAAADDLDDLSVPAEPAPPAAAPVPAESFEQRDPERRDEILDQMGGGSDTEEAVGRALAWFAKHQSSDGHWSSRGLGRAAAGDACDCGDPAEVDMDVASTSLVVLCFLAAGHTHVEPGPYRDLVDRGIRWLLARQGPDGDLRRARVPSRGGAEPPDTMYGHTIAAVALCEASAMTRDAPVGDAARRAVAFVVAQAARPGGASSDDTSVLGWQVMAIESARRAGVASSRGATAATMRNARAWLDSVETNGRYAYRRAGTPTIAMTAEAMFVRQLLDQFDDRPPDALQMGESSAFVLEAMPSWADGAPTHHWYYATLALFQHQSIDPQVWTRWNEALKPELLAHQRRDGHAAGSWDPHDEWSRLGGRTYQTAICTLSLEVYYRYRAGGILAPLNASP